MPIGIPDRQNYPDPKELEIGKIYKYLVQKHLAKKRGPHLDLRIGDQDTGLHSWATTRLHNSSQPLFSSSNTVLIHQPLHNYSYKDFQGIIAKGYGAGKVKKLQEGNLLITKKDAQGIHFTTADSNPQRVAIIGPHDDKKWLVMLSKAIAHPGTTKPKMTSVPKEEIEERLDNLGEGEVVQPKIDGSFIIVDTGKGAVELLSQRISKKTNKPIVSTEKFFGCRPSYDIPAKYKHSILFGEMYGLKGKQIIPAQELGGILNSNIANSIQAQQEKGIKLKTMLFDVASVGGKNVADLSYNKRKLLLAGILKHLPEDKFHLPEETGDKAEAKQWLASIMSGKHNLTNEGLILRSDKGAEKLKLTNEFNVYIKKLFEGTGKYKGMAGGFEYSHKPDGKIVGKVGTGFSDELRKQMWDNPAEYEGLKARVHAQERYSGGALRAPSLMAVEATT
jgi:hypothetical protein